MKNIEEIKELLLEQEVKDLSILFADFNVNLFDANGNNILHYYIKNHEVINIDSNVFVKELISKDLDINAVQSKAPNRSALHFAIKVKSKSITKLLLSFPEIKIDLGDKNGNTPLWESVMDYRNEDSFFIKILISNGADKNVKNKHGVSPLSLSNTIANYTSNLLLTSSCDEEV
jgi:ankyrin repeat protein